MIGLVKEMEESVIGQVLQRGRLQGRVPGGVGISSEVSDLFLLRIFLRLGGCL